MTLRLVRLAAATGAVAAISTGTKTIRSVASRFPPTQLAAGGLHF